jgi:hypothetical protein
LDALEIALVELVVLHELVFRQPNGTFIAKRDKADPIPGPADVTDCLSVSSEPLDRYHR